MTPKPFRDTDPRRGEGQSYLKIEHNSLQFLTDSRCEVGRGSEWTLALFIVSMVTYGYRTARVEVHQSHVIE